MKARAWVPAALIAAASFAGTAGAVPISYTQLGTDPVTGVINQPNGNQANPVGAVYFSFTANAGSAVTIFGDRLDGDYDMSFWVFSGLFTDTSQFGGAFDAGDPGFTAFGDDQDPANIPGPFGDPNVSFSAAGGSYTVAVTSFLSGGSPPYDFRLTARGVNPVSVPEPGTLALLGLGLLGAGAARRWSRRG